MDAFRVASTGAPGVVAGCKPNRVFAPFGRERRRLYHELCRGHTTARHPQNNGVQLALVVARWPVGLLQCVEWQGTDLESDGIWWTCSSRDFRVKAQGISRRCVVVFYTGRRIVA